MSNSQQSKIERKLGILGGGQLAMMLTNAAHRLGIDNIYVLDPTPNCPASKVGAHQVIGSFRDKNDVIEFSKKVDVLTIDIEDVSIEALDEIQNQGTVKIYPDPKLLKVIQDKYKQKCIFSEYNYDGNDKYTPYLPINFIREYDNLQSLNSIIDTFKNVCKDLSKFKFVVKAKRGGYDGKGVWFFEKPEQVEELLKVSGMKRCDIYLENFVDIEKEIAVVYCGYGSRDDLLGYVEHVTYPIVETVQKDGICTTVTCPTSLTLKQREKVEEIVSNFCREFGTVGIVAMELFLTVDGEIFINEVSPRVHNTGHFTIEATNCSQFEQHIRAVMGLDIIEPKLTVPYAVMHNILSEGYNSQDYSYLSKSGSHWYGKVPTIIYKEIVDENVTDKDADTRVTKIFRKNRKIGHITQSLEPSQVSFPLIYIVMGSMSDLPTMTPAIDLLKDYKMPYKVDVVSAHRSPDWMYEFGKNVESLGGRVIIAAAGGAAHLPGMLASITPLPVIGVPIPSKHLNGQDSLLSIVEMPDGVPVATVGIGKAKNAAILALKIIGAMKEVKDIIKKNREKVSRQRSDLLEKLNYMN